MSKQEWLIGTVGLLAGIVLTILISGSYFSANHNGTGMGDMMKMMGGNRQVGMNMGMNDMMEQLSGKTGDEFDKAFITTMIMHHQGAIEMADAAKTSSQRGEIKKLSDDIIAAQTKEINEMKIWYKSWFNTEVPEFRMDGMMGSGGSGAMMGSDKSQANSSAPTESQDIDHEAHHAS
jgi:hypothetical protein